MCETSRPELETIRLYQDHCEEGKLLYLSMQETRKAYFDYMDHTGPNERCRFLYRVYDHARAAYNKHIDDSELAQLQPILSQVGQWNITHCIPGGPKRTFTRQIECTMQQAIDAFNREHKHSIMINIESSK